MDKKEGGVSQATHTPADKLELGYVNEESKDAEGDNGTGSPAVQDQQPADETPRRESSSSMFRRMFSRVHSSGWHTKESRTDSLDSAGYRPQMERTSSISAVRHVFGRIDVMFHRMPKWQFHLLIGTMIWLVCMLILLAIIAALYGFCLTYPRVVVSKVALNGPITNVIPIITTVQFSNPNRFPVKVAPGQVVIYTDPEHRYQLAAPTVPRLDLHSNTEGYPVNLAFNLSGAELGTLPGGMEAIDAVFTGKLSFLYTKSIHELTVMGLGFMPVMRKFRLQCQVLTDWGPAHHFVDPYNQSTFAMSDCYGRFV